MLQKETLLDVVGTSGCITEFCSLSWWKELSKETSIIMESLVKKKQKGAILELKRRHLKNTIFCTYTPYPAMKIRRISASSAQETRNDQFPIWRIHYNQYVDSVLFLLSKRRICSSKHMAYSVNSIRRTAIQQSHTVKKKITIVGPIMKEYISTTSKRFISNNNNGKMIEKNFIEIEGTFLLKVCDNAFHGNYGEDVFKHINSFLKVVEPLKIRGLSHDRFRLSVFPTSLSSAAKEWFTNECIITISTWDDLVKNFVLKFYNLCEHDEEEETNDDNDPDVIDNVLEIFKIDNDLFNFDSPLCIAFEEFNHLLKIDPDLFTYDIQGFKMYDEYAQELNNKTQGNKEPWSENGVPYQLCDHICEPYCFKNGKTKWPTCSSDIDGFCNGGELPGMVQIKIMSYFQDHKWDDELMDGKLKDETLTLKTKVEKSWGDATLGVMKFCIWLKNSFENFHELNHNVLVKLQECWWKVNTYEIAPFTQTEDFRRGPYANMKTNWTHDPYLGTNQIFGASNVSSTRENQGYDKHMGNETPEQLVCKIGRFETMKYSFSNNEEYIIIKESDHLNHSKKGLDAYRELSRLTNEG
ncbi:hypothetical protein Tco_0268540 [Tanacetum coccineum]